MRRKTTEEFIQDAYCVHGDQYNYKLVEYIGNKSKVKIICPVHGVFEQIPNNHLMGHGCKLCGDTQGSYKQRLPISILIDNFRMVHGDVYDYNIIEYTNSLIKIKIVCPVHGVFEQLPTNHLNGHGCPKCVGRYENMYTKNNIPLYETFHPQLGPYGVECRRSPDDENVLEVKCHLDGCDEWFVPIRSSVKRKFNPLRGI
jgi:hypothetical protein